MGLYNLHWDISDPVDHENTYSHSENVVLCYTADSYHPENVYMKQHIGKPVLTLLYSE